MRSARAATTTANKRRSNKSAGLSRGQTTTKLYLGADFCAYFLRGFPQFFAAPPKNVLARRIVAAKKHRLKVCCFFSGM